VTVKIPKRWQDQFVLLWMASKLLVLGIVIALLIIGVYVFLEAISPSS
jgi:hypothetical protein